MNKQIKKTLRTNSALFISLESFIDLESFITLESCTSPIYYRKFLIRVIQKIAVCFFTSSQNDI